MAKEDEIMKDVICGDGWSDHQDTSRCDHLGPIEPGTSGTSGIVATWHQLREHLRPKLNRPQASLTLPAVSRDQINEWDTTVLNHPPEIKKVRNGPIVVLIRP